MNHQISRSTCGPKCHVNYGSKKDQELLISEIHLATSRQYSSAHRRKCSYASTLHEPHWHCLYASEASASLIRVEVLKTAVLGVARSESCTHCAYCVNQIAVPHAPTQPDEDCRERALQPYPWSTQAGHAFHVQVPRFPLRCHRAEVSLMRAAHLSRYTSRRRYAATLRSSSSSESMAKIERFSTAKNSRAARRVRLSIL